MEMVERNGIGDLVTAEHETEATDFLAVAHARPVIRRESSQDLKLEEASATTGNTEHVVLEAKSGFFRVAMDADDDTPVQIPLSTLAEGRAVMRMQTCRSSPIGVLNLCVYTYIPAGGEGSEDKKFEVSSFACTQMNS